jgi:hypothetical protein
MRQARQQPPNRSKQKKSSSEPAWLTTAFEVQVFAGAPQVKSRRVSDATYTTEFLKKILNTC